MQHSCQRMSALLRLVGSRQLRDVDAAGLPAVLVRAAAVISRPDALQPCASFASAAQPDPESSQAQEQASEPTQEQYQAAADIGGRPHRQPAPSAASFSQQRQQQQPSVAPSWRQEAQRDSLAAQLLALLDAGNAQEARRVFDKLLTELKVEQLVEAGSQAAADAAAAAVGDEASLEAHYARLTARKAQMLDMSLLPEGAAQRLPSLTAWKLYFTAMDVSRASPTLMCSKLHTMHALGHTQLAAPYAVLLKRCSDLRWGRMAYSKILEMKHRGLKPSFQCMLFAIDAARKSGEPGYLMRLFEEVWQGGYLLSGHSRQGTEYGRLSLQAIRDYYSWGRFNAAFQLMDELTERSQGELRVPGYFLTDILHHVVQLGDVEAIQECVQRLTLAQHRFQVSPDPTSKIWCPVKVDEGGLLAALEVAAAKGHVPLAEATWALLRRSLALPNPPGFPFLHARYGQGAAQAAVAGETEAVEGGVVLGGQADEALPSGRAAGALPHTNGKADLQRPPPPPWAAAAAAGKGGGEQPPTPEAAAAIQEFLSSQSGVRLPAVASYHAYIHAHAAAGNWAGMFEAIALLEDECPDSRPHASYHSGLQMVVDGLAQRGVEGVDAAYFLLEDWAREGRRVSTAQANCVLAACCQLGDLKRAFETFDALPSLGLEADADSYNALMQGCVESGELGAAQRVQEEMAAAGVQPNAHTHQLLVETQVVAGDVEAMMAALKALEAAGHTPKTALLERCIARCERAGATEPMKPLLQRLFSNDYRIVGLDAKQKRWASEGGMTMLTGSSKWVSREQVLREMQGRGSSSRGSSAGSRQQQHEARGEGGGSRHRRHKQ